ncbi:PRC-barrel domain-containing protein [Novosphingobium sp. PhB57]|uniref:PRC-barrel domain-containing protein n=1 Tax=Novosphingobium sp. PhB57 TaxID=2485107 RepID=UPI00104F5C49|nr:PRC-barrel domain-containing protein [Novosphingobium sp. PhB57]
MIAAMMTAANLGARITGWGFVVFTVGSIAWSIVGLSTGQTNLLATNGFLTLINLIGIWRWLGKQRAYEDGGKSATEASRRSAAPTLFMATGISGMPVEDETGDRLGKAVEALITCNDGNISYVVVSSNGIGGIGEDLRAVARADLTFACDRLIVRNSRAFYENLPALSDGEWPAYPGETKGAAAS